ncbi:choline/ethanolamine kinase family protein [Rhodovibrio salinarum]|uniref:LPS biosynthesis choline kinase n=1 Tax=Rhodovibrio salinarum TaxID=1087 RepID=A0A934QJP1_9PROT|nr:choline/ethanolamine kinase family protein [Rhodovibrio salinarum]MBK1698131.1 LPS biosynthesis choline kinase [Rhodovibrio salinarum]
MDDLAGYFARIPELKDLPASKIQAERLGGLTNLVYRIQTPDRDYVLRVAGPGTESFIDRKVEAHNARAAAAAGVSPEVLFVDESDGLMLMPHIPATTMSPESFRTTEGAPARAGAAFARLHDSGQTFEFRFELFQMIDGYLKLLGDLGATLPEGYHDVVREAEAVREVLDAKPAELAPCHCDPLCENFLDSGEAMWIVDWEYSGMNDPLWDLGDLSVEAGFTPEQDLEMMRAYRGGEVSEADFGRMVVYKAMCDLLWTLWGLIQHAQGNPAEDFWAYSIERFERCKILMGQAEFAERLAAVRAG